MFFGRSETRMESVLRKERDKGGECSSEGERKGWRMFFGRSETRMENVLRKERMFFGRVGKYPVPRGANRESA